MGSWNPFIKIGRMLVDDESALENRLNDLIIHINEINLLLGQENILCLNDDVSSIIDILHEQLSLITDTLSRGQYSPKGEIKNKIERLEKSKLQLQIKLQDVQKQKDEVYDKTIELTQEKSNLQMQIVELKNKLESSETRINDLTALLEQARHDKQLLCRQLEDEKKYSEQTETVLNKREKNFMNFCSSVISFRDQLFAQLTYAEEVEHNPQAVDIIKGIITLSRGEFEENNIEILDRDGEYDREVQYIAGSVPTDIKEQDMRIKETVKEGYRYENKLIRQQEVILYRFYNVSQ